MLIRDLEVAAARIALAPSATKHDAEAAGATPITRGMGIKIAGSIRQMAHIASTAGGRIFTTAEKCQAFTGKKKYLLRLWRLPQ